MPDTANFTPAFIVLGCVAGVAAIGTPLLWRALGEKRRGARLLITTFGCIGLAGLIGLGLEISNPSRYEMATVFALGSALLLQLLALPLLVFLSRKI